MSNIRTIPREDVAAVCPPCEAELQEVFVERPGGRFGIGQGYLFFCPSCHEVLDTGVHWYPFPTKG